MTVLAAVACLPQTFMNLHSSRLGHRSAGQWLRERADGSATVLDTVGWAGLYSGRRAYTYEDAPTALADPRLAFVVLEERELHYDSQRSRTLRQLVEVAGRPVAEFPSAAARRANQEPVVVYQWSSERFHGRAVKRTFESRREAASHDTRRDDHPTLAARTPQQPMAPQ